MRSRASMMVTLRPALLRARAAARPARPAEMKWEWLGDELVREKSPVYWMRRLRYRLTEDEWGYGWLMWPGEKGDTSVAPTKGAAKRGAVIALHQTSPAGKNEPVGLEDM